MLKLIMTYGLPASGKSTWAKDLIDKNPGKWKRINKDDLRAMLDNSKWSKPNEKFVLDTRDFVISIALIGGYNVIVDDTNLDPSHEKRLREIVESHNQTLIPSIEGMEKVTFEIKDFTNVSPEECLKRNFMREGKARVPENTIKDMYKKYLKPPIPVIPFNSKNPEAIICDLDGTLALFGDRNPYKRDFINDTVNQPVLDILKRYRKAKIPILLVSGRNGEFRNETLDWLQKNKIPWSELTMRSEGDIRKDSIVKKEIYDVSIKNFYNILFVLDDRDQVVELWRSLGLTCLQVAPGEF